MYQVQFKKSVLKDIKPFPQSVIHRIQEVTQQLSQNPRPPQSTKMKGKDAYRYRFSHYRIIYHINDKTKHITIYKIGHRKHIYR